MDIMTTKDKTKKVSQVHLKKNSQWITVSMIYTQISRNGQNVTQIIEAWGKIRFLIGSLLY